MRLQVLSAAKLAGSIGIGPLFLEFRKGDPPLSRGHATTEGQARAVACQGGLEGTGTGQFLIHG